MVVNDNLEFWWFDTSPDAGHPACKCSYCHNVIQEVELPMRMLDESFAGGIEARLCETCSDQYVKGELTGIAEMPTRLIRTLPANPVND